MRYITHIFERDLHTVMALSPYPTSLRGESPVVQPDIRLNRKYLNTKQCNSIQNALNLYLTTYYSNLRNLFPNNFRKGLLNMF
jgi:hypothetical protein